MAAKKTAETAETTEITEAAESTAQAQEKTDGKVRKFPLDRLQKDCMRLFGVTVSTFTGAVHDLADGDYTVEEIKSHIEDWKKKEVK